MAIDASAPLSHKILRSVVGDQWHLLCNKSASQQFNVSVVCTIETIERVSCVQFSPEGKYIAVGCLGSVTIHDCESGHKITSFSEEQKELVTRYVRAMIWLGPEGQHLLILMSDATLRIWNVENGHSRKVELGLGEPEEGISLSWDGTLVISKGSGCLKVWDLDIISKYTAEFRVSIPTNARHWRMKISPCKNFFAVLEEGRIVTVYDTRSGLVVTQWAPGDLAGFVSDMVFTSKGRELLVATPNEGIFNISIATAKVNAVVEPTSISNKDVTGAGVSSLCCSPDDRWVLAGDFDGSIHLLSIDGHPHFSLIGTKRNSGISFVAQLIWLIHP